ncbi:MAG: hypothetical protein OEW00_00585 [candidate division Zixibacteria bacterium]|nr:hypothetical protein [candidate division Zixibacteria bacterium]
MDATSGSGSVVGMDDLTLAFSIIRLCRVVRTFSCSALLSLTVLAVVATVLVLTSLVFVFLVFLAEVALRFDDFAGFFVIVLASAIDSREPP